VRSVSSHFNRSSESQDITALYTRLSKIKVFIAEKITSTYSITQDGVQTTLPALQSEIHVATNATTGSWDIFLSADDDSRDFCIASKLPLELGAILSGCKPSAVDPRAVSVLASIVHAKRRSVGRVLASNGIEELLDLPVMEGTDEDAGDFETLSITAGRSTSRAVGSATRYSTQEPSFGGDWEPSFRDASASPDTVVVQEPRHNEPYVRLLAQVVQEARGLLDFPSQGDVLVAGTQSVYRFAGGDQQTWRRMCGCAGELFVSLPLVPHFSPTRCTALETNYIVPGL
jgi:hypothetical protein